MDFQTPDLRKAKDIPGWPGVCAFWLMLCISALMVCASPLPAQAQETAFSETPRFDQLRERFTSGEIFQAAFSHEYMDSYTGEQTRTKGEIWIGETSYRVESDNQVMVVDGETSRVYDGIRNRLLISEYEEEEDDFAPSRMLQGVDNTYRIREEERSGGVVLIMVSEDPFSVFERVEIHLDSGGSPQEIEARDQADNLLLTQFQNGGFTSADPALFSMDVPEDAERIDLRH